MQSQNPRIFLSSCRSNYQEKQAQPDDLWVVFTGSTSFCFVIIQSASQLIDIWANINSILRSKWMRAFFSPNRPLFLLFFRIHLFSAEALRDLDNNENIISFSRGKLLLARVSSRFTCSHLIHYSAFPRCWGHILLIWLELSRITNNKTFQKSI